MRKGILKINLKKKKRAQSWNLNSVYQTQKAFCRLLKTFCWAVESTSPNLQREGLAKVLQQQKYIETTGDKYRP